MSVLVHSEGIPSVSVVVPCRNEEGFIGAAVESLLRGDFPISHLEVLIVDGVSTDGTRTVAHKLARSYPGVIRLLDNPSRVTPVALNVGIRAASGEIVVRVDAHAVYPPDYLSRLIGVLLASGADNVGGIIRTVPRRSTLFGRAVAKVLAHPVGVGNSEFRLGRATAPVKADTVPFLCVRRDLFDRVGLFNENLKRGQDMEFSKRLARAGCVILLVPDVVVDYFARSTWMEFAKHNWENGVWAVVPFRYSTVVPVAVRHLVPMAFVGGIALALALSPWVAIAGVCLVAGLLGYALTILAVSLSIAGNEREPLLVFTLPLAFFSLHATYGMGSLWGFARIAPFLPTMVIRRLRRGT